MLEQINEMKSYFESLITRDYKFRLNQLKKLKIAIKKNENAILFALKNDLGKSEFEAYLMEIAPLYEEIEFAIKNLKKWMKPKSIKSPIFFFPSKGKMYYDPLGVVLIMSPWNYPFQLTIAPLIASIAGGNCSVIKPSRYSPFTSKIIRKIIEEYFEIKYITIFEGGADVNTQLLEIKFDHIFFTGSPEVGRIVMAAASKHLTPVTLELGGKNPCIIDRTADVKIAAKRITWGKCLNCGQTCVEPDYILVHSSIKEDFIKYAVEYIKDAYGNTPLSSPDYPRIINEKHFKRLCGLIEGEKIVFGGKTDKATLKIEPTIIDILNIDSPIMREEIFGPLMPILSYNDSNEIYSIIKRFPNSLALYLFTKDKHFEDEIIQRIPFGGGCINDVILHVGNSNAHFGGIGESGMGAYHGKKGFLTLTHEKYVLKKSLLLDLPRYPPYNNKINLLRKFMH